MTVEIVTTEEHHVEHHHTEEPAAIPAALEAAPAAVVHHVEERAPETSPRVEALLEGVATRLDTLIALQRDTFDRLDRDAHQVAAPVADVPEAAADDAVEIPLDAVDPPPAEPEHAPRRKKRRRM